MQAGFFYSSNKHYTIDIPFIVSPLSFLTVYLCVAAFSSYFCTHKQITTQGKNVKWDEPTFKKKKTPLH